MKIEFKADTEHGVFSDALYFEDDAVPDEATIEAMKQERVNNWIIAVTTPAAPEIVELNGVQYEKIVLDGQVVLKPVGA